MDVQRLLDIWQVVLQGPRVSLKEELMNQKAILEQSNLSKKLEDAQHAKLSTIEEAKCSEQSSITADKRKNKDVAVVYPIKKHSVIASLAGKYKDRVEKVDDLEMAKEEAMRQAMAEKYDLPH